MQQIVCRFAKREAVKFISHLDLMRALERAMRRARLPLAWSEGFNPRPRVSYASALSVGHTSDAELLAVALTAPMDPADVRKALNASLPEGLEILQAWATPPHKPRASLGDTDVAEYSVRIQGPVGEADLERKVAEFTARDEVWIVRVREKTKKDMNVRPLVGEVALIHAGAGEAELRMRLRTGSAGGAKPEEVLLALGIQGRQFRMFIQRTALYASGAAGRGARQRLRRLLGNE